MRKRFSAWTTAMLVCLAGLCAGACGSAGEIGQDFRGKPYDPEIFKPTGPGFARAIRSDRQGLRIVLPPEHGKKPPVGVVFRTGVKGDFDITMEFEVVEVKQPADGQGAGPSLYIAMESPTQEAATTGWQLKPDGSSVFFSHQASTPPGNTREHAGKTIPAGGRSGKVRLVRTGSILAYLAADGTSDSYREIDQFEIGTDAVNTVRVAASNGGSPTQVDVRINSVKVVADDLGDTTPLPPRASRWPLWLGAGAVLAAGGAYAVWRRR